MKLIIANHITVQDPDPELRDYLKGLLTLVNPEWVKAKKFNRSTIGVPRILTQFDLVGKDVQIPRGLLRHVVEDLGLEFEIEDRTVAPAAPAWPEPIATLRPDDQEPAAVRLLQSTNGFLQAPAGTGKTVLGLEICRRLGLRTLWLTHQKQLKKQVMEEAQDLFGLDMDEIGVLHERTWRMGDRLTVGMIPTLKKRDLSEISRGFGLVVIDEAHHVPCQSFLSVLSHFHSRYIYGLTATAYRNDGLESLMFNAIGPIEAQIEHRELFEDEHLIKPDIVIRKTSWCPNDAFKLEYHEFMEKMVSDVARNRLILSDLLKVRKPEDKFVVLVERTKHAEILTKLIQEAGLKCEYVVGSVDVEEPPKKKQRRGAKKVKPKKRAIPQRVRDQVIEDLKSGKLDGVVATWDLLAEGFNYRPLSLLILASPLRYKGTVTQGIGRVQRPSEGKTGALVLDYVDSLIPMFDRQAQARIHEVYLPMEMPVRTVEQGEGL